jgi:hypothetical protein
MSTAARLRHSVASHPAVRRARPTLADVTAKLSARLRGSEVVASPVISGELPADGYALELGEWTVFHSRLFVRFDLATEGGAPRPVRALVTFSGSAIVLPEGALAGEPVEIRLPDGPIGDLALVFEQADGQAHVVPDPAERGLTDDPGGRLFGRFASELDARPSGRVLEIGSRARSGNVYRSALVPERWEYIGLDIKEGPNVDVVGDAHDLADAVGVDRFDAVYSIATFEHLAMPWRAAVSVNRVLRDDGLVFLASHQAFPMHETPWDFWRFSDQAWGALLNKSTGFEILEVALGEPANVVPTWAKNALGGVDTQPAFLSSSVLARKTGRSIVEWDVPTDQVVTDFYPH